MNYIVDTRYLLWSLVSPGHISGAHAAILEDPEHVKYVSTISFWEVSLKYALGKLSMKGSEPAALPAAARRAGFEVLPVSADDFAKSYQLQSPAPIVIPSTGCWYGNASGTDSRCSQPTRS